MSDSDMDDQKAILGDLKSVLAYLHGRGYAISRSGLYKHHSEGKFRKDTKSGGFVIDKINKYAADHLPLESTGEKVNVAQDQLQSRKLKVGIRREEALAAKAEHELNVLKGKYVEKETQERDLVARALVLDSTLRNQLKSFVPDLIELVGGDQSKGGEVKEHLMNYVDKVMTTFAGNHDFVVELDIEAGEGQKVCC